MRIPLRTLLAAGLLAGLIGCSSDSVESPVPSFDVSAAISQTTLGDLNSYAAVSTLIHAPATSTVPTVIPSACAYSAADQSFVCPTATVGGLTFKTSYFLYDAAGHPQSQANVATTASLRTIVDVTGTASFTQFDALSATATLNRHSDMTLSGLLGATRTLNGTTHEHDDVTTSGTIASHSVIDVTSATLNVVLPSSGTSKWPQSGTITSDVASATSLGPLPAINATSHSVITFDGTSVITVVATVAGHLTTCRIDLTGAASPSCS